MYSEIQNFNFNVPDPLAQQWHQQYPKSYIAFVEIEDVPERYLGRVIKNITGETIPVDNVNDCICVHIGLRGQTSFNFAVSIAGISDMM